MKERYIKQVEKELNLSRKAKKEVVRDLNEIFASALEHGETAQQVIERLGTPKEFANIAAEQFGVNIKRKKIIISGIVIVAVLTVLSAITIIWSPVIFQRGNPIPYLVAATKISDEEPYVHVDVDGGTSVYIALKGECPELFEYVHESRNVEFLEQAGSGYIFSNGVDNLVVSSEIYWGKYMVWQVPNKTLADSHSIGTEGIGSAEVEPVDYPPMVMFNNTLYTATSYSGDKENLSTVGKIESCIDYGVPTENNQANDALVGCEIYMTSSAPDYVFVLNNGVYSPYKSTDGTGIE